MNPKVEDKIISAIENIPQKSVDLAEARLEPIINTEIKQAVAIEPTTTAEQQRITAGQRRINRIWEVTQAFVTCIVIAITATGVTIKVLRPDASSLPSEWWTIVGLIVGFYFSRTNHTKQGGVNGLKNIYEER